MPPAGVLHGASNSDVVIDKNFRESSLSCQSRTRNNVFQLYRCSLPGRAIIAFTVAQLLIMRKRFTVLIRFLLGRAELAEWELA